MSGLLVLWHISAERRKDKGEQRSGAAMQALTALPYAEMDSLPFL